MVIGFISKLVRTITLSRVVIWALTALLCISLFTLYENRSKLITAFTAPDITNVTGTIFTVGEETKIRLEQLTKNEEKIVGVSVMSADLRLNEARFMYFVSDTPAFEEVISKSKLPDTNRLPLFTSIDENNTDIIKLINGQFSCTKFEATLESKLYPQLGSSVKAVCRTSIPSYYGYFSGYVQLYISDQVGSEYQLQLKLIVEKLANDIYFKDVLPTQRVEKISVPKAGQ